MKLIFATANPGKLREAREILEPHGFEVVSPYDVGLTKAQVDVEETGKTFEENAIIKVQNLWQLTGLPCFADDSGLVVDALGGAPASILPAMPPSTALAKTTTSPRISTNCCATCWVFRIGLRVSSAWWL